MMTTFINKVYPNKFVQLGYDPLEVNERLNQMIQTVFFGTEDERIYGEIGDMGYVEDTGNHDVRTEGMSYAMMVFVQMDMKAHFDKIWKFAKTYMFMNEGENAGYFAWSVGKDGTKFSNGPAPDGEEYFAMALFFASHRWGNGDGLLNYEAEAKQLLSTCVHKGENNTPGHPMWEPTNKLIKFIPNVDFSDPSYHLPHFYELFALWANEEDKTFWKEAAEASRAYLKKSCHAVTGLNAEYADYEGHPQYWNGHDVFYSDSYRVAANIGLYHAWFGDDADLCDCVHRQQLFLKETVADAWDYMYTIDGTRITDSAQRNLGGNLLSPECKILHPIGLLATNAMGSLATTGALSDACVREFYETPLRTGDRRYYDNFLYIFSWLGLSGNYRIW